MRRESDSKEALYCRRSRRTAWVAAAACGLLGATSLAEKQHDYGFGGICVTVGFLLFVWGFDYHRRLRPSADGPPRDANRLTTIACTSMLVGSVSQMECQLTGLGDAGRGT